MNSTEYENLLENARAELDLRFGENLDGKTKAEKMREVIKRIQARRRMPADFVGATSGSNPDSRTGPSVNPRIDTEEESGEFYEGVEQALKDAGFELADTSEPGEFRKTLHAESRRR
jgi:hypothetical protein